MICAFLIVYASILLGIFYRWRLFNENTKGYVVFFWCIMTFFILSFSVSPWLYLIPFFKAKISLDNILIGFLFSLSLWVSNIQWAVKIPKECEKN